MAEQGTRAVSEEVSWPLEDTTVYGTLMRPSGAGPFPAVVFIAGSGPTDRDWTTPLLLGANGSAALLAGALAERGFASLRYDKRVSGPHAAENFAALVGKISMRSHVDEVAGAAAFLAASDYVDPSRIFVLSNSEGALHALNYQLSNPSIPFAGLALTAPPGRVMGEVGRSQVAAQLSALPNGQELLARYDAAIARFEAGEEVAVDPGLPEGVQMLLMGLSAPANLPFARELWSASAADLLAQVKQPVLVVIGQKDIQVDWQADGEPLRRAAAARDDVRFVFPENANHVLKREVRSRADLSAAEVASGYNAPDAVLDPDALAAVVDWLAEQA